jgi:conserved repeat domain
VSEQTPDPVTDSEEVPVEGTPGLVIDKIVVDVDGRGPDATVTAAGQVITYDIVVTNTGNVTLTDVTVTDPLTGTDVNIGDLAPAASFTVENQTYAAQQSDIDTDGGGDGDIDNTAAAVSEQTPDPVTDSEEVPVEGTPGLVIDKIVVDVDGRGPDATVTAAGQVITYDIVVTNTGNVTLTDVTVTDPLTGTDVNIGDLRRHAS